MKKIFLVDIKKKSGRGEESRLNTNGGLNRTMKRDQEKRVGRESKRGRWRRPKWLGDAGIGLGEGKWKLGAGYEV